MTTMIAERRRSRQPRRPRQAVLSAVRPIVERLASAHGLMIWDLDFAREAGRQTLRVACDRKGGVDADELARLAGDLSRELDHTDAVPGRERYVLEVTSPGAERTLSTPEQFDVCRGRIVKVWFQGEREPVIGEIGDVTPASVDVVGEDETQVVSFDEIARAQLQVLGVG